MKKYLILISIILLINLTFVSPSFAQKTTPTSTINQQQIDELKNKIASRVAELKLVEKRGVIGNVTDVSHTQITVTDQNGDIKNIDVDELTKFYSSSSQSFGISDIKTGQTLGVLGLYNKQSKRILAREVNALSAPPIIILGVVTDIDKKNFEFVVVKQNLEKITVSVEDVTKTYSYLQDAISKSGFSKIQQLQTTIITGYLDKQDPKKILSSRIIFFPDVNLAAKLNLSLEPTIIPSTGSGVKLYPITK